MQEGWPARNQCLSLPCLQDQWATWYSLHHWPLHQLRHWHADPIRQTPAALDRPWSGSAVSAGQLGGCWLFTLLFLVGIGRWAGPALLAVLCISQCMCYCAGASTLLLPHLHGNGVVRLLLLELWMQLEVFNCGSAWHCFEVIVHVSQAQNSINKLWKASSKRLEWWDLCVAELQQNILGLADFV